MRKCERMYYDSDIFYIENIGPEHLQRGENQLERLSIVNQRFEVVFPLSSKLERSYRKQSCKLRDLRGAKTKVIVTLNNFHCGKSALGFLPVLKRSIR